MPSSCEIESLGGGDQGCIAEGHRFGTDAFLLANFAAPRHKDRVADLGTGCGIIPLLLQKDFQPAGVVGVDIQPEAIDLFTRSIALSGSGGELQPLCADLRALKGQLPADRFDLVTCNPPYYEAADAGLLGQLPARQIARHELYCTLGDVCAAAFLLLKTGGRLCICQRPERLTDVLTAMRQNRLEPKRLRMVAQNPQSGPWLFLAEGKKDAKPGLVVLPALWMTKADGSPSDELRQIYGFDIEKDVIP